MSWNIELLIIEPQLSAFDQIGMLEIAAREKEGIPFWDATSFTTLGNGIAVGNFDSKTILIDPSCRLLNALPSVLNDLGEYKIVFARVANQKVCKAFEKGQEKKDSFFKSDSNKNKEADGEIEAWNYIREKTGLSTDSLNSSKNLNKSTYSLYVL